MTTQKGPNASPLGRGCVPYRIIIIRVERWFIGEIIGEEQLRIKRHASKAIPKPASRPSQNAKHQIDFRANASHNVKE